MVANTAFRVAWEASNLQKKVKDTIAKLQDTKPLLDRLGVQASQGLKSNVKSERDHSGAKWPDLSAATKAARATKMSTKRRKSVKTKSKGVVQLAGYKMLQDTGAMIRGIGYRYDGPKAIVAGTSAKKSGVDYGLVHNSPVKAHVPKREWIYLSRDTKEKLRKALINYLKGAFKSWHK